jgi:hypothetical protein
MKRIHYLLLGLLVSLTIAAVSPGLPPTRIAPGTNTTVVTNGVNSFTISSSAGASAAQLAGTNVFTGTNRFTLPVIATNTGSIFAGDNFTTLAASSASLAIDAPSGAIRGLALRSNALNNYNNGVSIIANPANYVQIYDGAGGNAIRILSSGYVGIGLTAPTERLHVVGNALITTNLTANDLSLSKTITAPATTGNQTINKAAGRVNIAAAGTTVVVTCSLVTANSIIIAVAATADATARVTNVVPAAGSFTINTVATTAETAFNFLIVN